VAKSKSYNNNPSSELLFLPTAAASHTELHRSPTSTSAFTMLGQDHAKEKDRGRSRERTRSQSHDALADVAGDKKQAKVQFPEDLDKASGPTTLPYPFIRQDSDVFSSRASSIGGTLTDDDVSEDYDWSDEEDLVDEEAKFEKKMGVKTKREGWGFKRFVSFCLSSID